MGRGIGGGGRGMGRGMGGGRGMGRRMGMGGGRGRGRALDNVFIERLWRNVKYEDIYLNEYEYENVPALHVY